AHCCWQPHHFLFRRQVRLQRAPRTNLPDCVHCVARAEEEGLDGGEGIGTLKRIGTSHLRTPKASTVPEHSRRSGVETRVAAEFQGRIAFVLLGMATVTLLFVSLSDWLAFDHFL